MKMTYTFHSDIRHDAARILGTHAGAMCGFFTAQHFIILPYAYKNTVYLPDIDYSQIKPSPTASYHPDDYSEKQLSYITKQIQTNTNNKNIDILLKNIQLSDQQIQNIFLILFPTIFPLIKHIHIILTPYGTTCSFDFKKDKKSYDIYLWIRNDDAKNLFARYIHAFVSVLVLIETGISDIHTEEWRHKEYLIDYLLRHTSLSAIHPVSQRTLASLKINQLGTRHQQTAEIFLTKLGLNKKLAISKKDGQYYLADIKIEHLTHNEMKLIDTLYEKRGEYVSKNDLMGLLYGEDGGNEWSLTKQIQRLREKIRKTGIYHTPIMTNRKRGYMLR